MKTDQIQRARPLKVEYMLAVLLEQKEPGETFGRWPLHITLMPWFDINHNQPDQFLKSLQSVLGSFQSFKVSIGPQDEWGPHTVFVIDSLPLRALHNELLELVTKQSKLTEPLKFTGPDYKPHITQKAYATVQPGFSVKIHKVYLIEAPKTTPINRFKKVVGIGELK